MLRILFSLLILFTLLDSSPSIASSGNDILNRCGGASKETHNTHACASFVSGMLEGIAVSFGLFVPENQTLSNQDYASKLYSAIGYCLPHDASISQLTEIYINHLIEYINERHNPASILFINSMRNAFPCTHE